jgi:alcohol dehydrogenase (cytochrome c)
MHSRRSCVLAAASGAVLLVGLLVGACGVGDEAPVQESAISPSPAFGVDELLASPREGWITNGGSVFNQRYSPLDQVNRDTVGDLKAVRRISLDGSGDAAGYSAEAQPIVHDGVIYIVTGEDDVFAIDVETGAQLWFRDSGIDFDVVRVCCGRLSRGLGLGDGKVFVGQVDGVLTALDQQTGETVWRVDVADPAEGYSLTAAPLYYEGMVITGVAGGDLGTRGRVMAYDADTGAELWRFYTIPGPGEFGHDTWPADSDAWTIGGAPVWQTPAVDPELGLIYFSTGNAWPTDDGGSRPGDNLFAVSVVALDVATGEYRWHFQQVRHDIWDYDSPNPVILFDALYDGAPRRGLASASKSGYLYILDRTNGEPLTPVVDTPVPQDPALATAATQPIPQGDLVVPDFIDAVGEDYPGLPPNWGRTFTPVSEAAPAIYAPLSGVNWHPSSYEPASNTMFLCASEGPGGDRTGVQTADRPTRRFMAAMKLTDHSAVWRRQLRARCLGSTTTAGGLTFTGLSDGRLLALDSDTGDKLWEFQTDGGVAGGISIFEHKGEELIAVMAGGGVFGGKTSDGLWLFSLSGTIDSLPPGSAEPPERPADPFAAAGPAVPTDRVADLARGEEIYSTICQICHGEDGRGEHEGGAPLPAELTLEAIIETADAGRPGTNMQSFRGLYTDEELHDVASYIKGALHARRD